MTPPRPRLTSPLRKADRERLGLRRANAEPDDLAAALGVDGDGDYRRDRDDAAAVADLQVGRAEPQIRPFAVDRAVEEGVYSLVDVFPTRP